jgi:SAM-dependent methyltransferase
MARVYGEVVGIDLSNTFIDAAKLMAEQRRIDYALPVEGEVVLPLAATIPDDIDVSRVQFMQGDACALPARLGTFDAVLAANLLCRVPNPRTCLNEISRSLAPGGLLVMTSPFTWMEQYTDKALWVGATYDDKGQPRRWGEGAPLLLLWHWAAVGLSCDAAVQMHGGGGM